MRHVVFALALASSASLAQEIKPRVLSRNMPETCEFVYRVESDIQISPPADLGAARMRVSFMDVYTDTWSNTEDHLFETITLTSFSSNPRYLYRFVRFEFVDIEGRLLSGPWISEFARQFGESCHSGGRAYTPWRERDVRLLAD